MAGESGQIAAAFVRIYPDLSDFQATVEAGATQAGDQIATGVQAGLREGAAGFAPTEGQLSMFGAEAGAKIGDGLAAGVASGVEKSVSELEAIPAAAAAAAEESAAAGKAASDKMGSGFMSGGMGKIFGGGLIAAIGGTVLGHLASSAADTAEQMMKLQTVMGLSAQQAQRFAIEASGAGLSTQKLTVMAGRLDKQLASASSGSASQAKALDQLGISADTFANSKAPEQAALLAKHIAESNLPAKELSGLVKKFNIDPAALTGAHSYGDLLKVIEKGLQTSAQTGNAFARTLAQNGISITAFKAQNFPDQLATIAAAYEKAKTPAQGLALVMTAFGRQGVQMLPMIQNMAMLKKTADELHLPKIDERGAEVAGMQFKELDTYVKFLAQDLAVKLVPPITAVAKKLIDIATPIVEFVKHSAAAQAAIAALAGGFLAFKAVGVVESIFTPIITVIRNLVTLIPGVTAEMVGLDTAMDANPIGAVAVAIGALIAGLVVLYEKVPAVRNVINDAFSGIKAVVGDTVTFLEGLWARWGATITADTDKVWGVVKQVVSDAIKVVSAVIQTTVQVIEAIWQRWGSTIESVARTYFDAVKTEIETVVKVIADIIRIALDLIHGHWSKAWKDLENLVSTVFSGIETIILDSTKIMLTLAEAVGKAILDGVLAGLKGIADLVMKGLGKIGDGISTIAADALKWGEQLGETLVKGILSGLGGLAKDVGGGIVSGLKGAVSWAGGILHGSGNFQFTNEAVGVPMGQGILDGIDKALAGNAVGKKMASKIKDATASALESLQTSFKSLEAKAKELGPSLGAAGEAALQKLHDAVAHAVTTTDVTNARAAISKASAQLSSDLATLKQHIADAKVFDGLKTQAAKLGQDVTPAITAAMKKIQDEMATVVTVSGQAKIASQVTKLKNQIAALLQQIKTKISSEQSAFSSAFSQLVAPLDSAFQKATQKALASMQVMVKTAQGSFLFGGAAGSLTPAEVQLQNLQAAHDAAALQAQLAADQAQLTADQAGNASAIAAAQDTYNKAAAAVDAAKNALLPDPASIKEAQDALANAAAGLKDVTDPGKNSSQTLADTQAIAEDNYNIQIAALQKTADAENQAAQDQLQAAQSAFQDQRDLLQTQMDQRLAILEKGMEDGTLSAQQGMDALNAILTDPNYALNANGAAFAIGGNIYTGLQAGLAPVFQLLTQLQTDLSKVGVKIGGGTIPYTSPVVTTTTPAGATSQGSGPYIGTLTANDVKQQITDPIVDALATQTKVIQGQQTTVNVTSSNPILQLGVSVPR